MAFDGNFLASLTDAERADLAADAVRLTIMPGATIIWRGEILNRFYFLDTGRAEAKYRLRRSEAVLSLSPGDFFGERALEDDATSDSSVRSTEPLVAVAVPAEAMRRLLANNQTASRSLWERIESRRISLWSASGVLQSLPVYR